MSLITYYILQELMKLMGLPNWMHWLCWFLDGTISAAISVFIAVLLVCVEWESGVGRVIYYSNGFIIYLFFMLYAMSLVIFLFAFSTLVSSRKLTNVTSWDVVTLKIDILSCFCRPENAHFEGKQRPLYTWTGFQFIIPPFLMHIITENFSALHK